MKNKNFNIIIVCGFSNSGKDVFSDYLVSKYNYKKMALADKLKEDVSNLYNIPIEMFLTQENKRLIAFDNLTHRDLLIKHAATERNKNENVYVNYLIDNIKHVYYKNIVISDIRYNNEISNITDLLSDCYKITSVKIDRYEKSIINDASERQLLSYTPDYIIQNKSSIDDFKNRIDEFISLI